MSAAIPYNNKPGGFVRCPRCTFMWGPVFECPGCRFSLQCDYCRRVWVPGRGWQQAPHGFTAYSHGNCQHCGIRRITGWSPETVAAVVSTAAARLRMPTWCVEARFTRWRGLPLIALGHGENMVLRRLWKKDGGVS